MQAALDQLHKANAYEVQKLIVTFLYLLKANMDQRATLLIVDRTIDATAPLLSEFTFQAMVYNLLEIKKDRYSYYFLC